VIKQGADIKSITTDLQGLGLCLKMAASKLPNSVFKQDLLFEITKSIKIESVADFYLLQNKIINRLSLAVKEKLNEREEVMILLRKIKKYMKKMSRYIGRESFRLKEQGYGYTKSTKNTKKFF